MIWNSIRRYFGKCDHRFVQARAAFNKSGKLIKAQVSCYKCGVESKKFKATAQILRPAGEIPDEVKLFHIQHVEKPIMKAALIALGYSESDSEKLTNQAKFVDYESLPTKGETL